VTRISFAEKGGFYESVRRSEKPVYSAECGRDKIGHKKALIRDDKVMI